MYTISKTLSANDTGETGGHQAGILIPKNPDILKFFPKLRKEVKNPRLHINFLDESGGEWVFAFIYYNNRLFGGTRNEYRLTRMTGYIRSSSLVAGDELIFTNRNGQYMVGYNRRNSSSTSAGILKLGSGWKVIQI